VGKGKRNRSSNSYRTTAPSQPPRAAVEKVIGGLLSDRIPRTEDSILEAVLAKYRVVFASVVHDLLRHGARFESTDNVNWRLRATPSAPRTNVDRKTVTPSRPQKKKAKEGKNGKMGTTQAARPNATSGNAKRRRNRIDSPRVSVWTVSGGLPGSGKKA
jgi:hypothetical protein